MGHISNTPALNHAHRINQLFCQNKIGPRLYIFFESINNQTIGNVMSEVRFWAKDKIDIKKIGSDLDIINLKKELSNLCRNLFNFYQSK